MVAVPVTAAAVMPVAVAVAIAGVGIRVTVIAADDYGAAICGSVGRVSRIVGAVGSGNGYTGAVYAAGTPGTDAGKRKDSDTGMETPVCRRLPCRRRRVSRCRFQRSRAFEPQPARRRARASNRSQASSGASVPLCPPAPDSCRVDATDYRSRSAM